MAQINPPREAYVRQQIYRAGQAQQPFYIKQGQSRVDIERDGVCVEAGDGESRAQVFLPTCTERVTKFVEVPQSKSLFERWSTYLIILLILLVIGGIAVGVAVHEMNKSSSYSYSR